MELNSIKFLTKNYQSQMQTDYDEIQGIMKGEVFGPVKGKRVKKKKTAQKKRRKKK